MAPMADGSVMVPGATTLGATTEAAGSLAANAGDADAAAESRAEKPVVLEEQTVPPEWS